MITCYNNHNNNNDITTINSLNFNGKDDDGTIAASLPLSSFTS